MDYGAITIDTSIFDQKGLRLESGILKAHVHFHVAGTLETGGTEWGDVPELSLEETEAIADKLRPLFR